MGRSRQEELTDSVLETASNLFAEKGFHETSTDELASRLGISKPTLYKYGSSKAAILQAIVRRNHKRALEEANRIAAGKAPPLDQLHELFRFHTHFAIEHRHEVRIIDGERHRLTDRDEIDRLAGEYLAYIKSQITAAQKVGDLRDDIPLELFARSFIALALGPGKWFVEKKKGLSEEDVIQANWSLFMHGAARVGK
jgi:AcrR family transcriptional regulator